MNTAMQDAFDIGWKVGWVLRGWAPQRLLDSYEDERRPVGLHNVERAGSPGGARRPSTEALPWDLYGRVAHHWLRDDPAVSTVDLVGDGLTILAGSTEPDWQTLGSVRGIGAPLEVRIIDPETIERLAIPPAGALALRPDGRVVSRWAQLEDARAAVDVALGPPTVARLGS